MKGSSAPLLREAAAGFLRAFDDGDDRPDDDPDILEWRDRLRTALAKESRASGGSPRPEYMPARAPFRGPVARRAGSDHIPQEGRLRVDYRDPRNGRRVEGALGLVEARAFELGAALAHLANALHPDVELTPAQAQHLAETLAEIGLIGGAILSADVERTYRRESH